jgi:trans-aconitate methyltransferase
MWKYRHLWNREAIMDQLGNDSLNHPHRKFLLEKIEEFEPFDSLLEFGCGAGANLLLLSQEYPGDSFYGYDINSNIELPSPRGNVSRVESLDDVESVDIVLVDAVFIYMLPCYVKLHLEKLKAIANKAILLFEWNIAGCSRIIWDHLAHDWKDILPGCKIIEVEDLYDDAGWKRWGTFITWQK